MKFTLINPQLVSQKTDLFSSGIPYFPIELAYLAAVLKKAGHEVNIIDAFGESPLTFHEMGKDFFTQGISEDDVLKKINTDADAVIIYASLVTTHSINIALAKRIKNELKKRVMVFENTQQVYAYSLKKMYKEFLANGVDYIITGEPEERIIEIIEAIRGKKNLSDIDGLAYNSQQGQTLNAKKAIITNLDALPYPAYEEFPLKNYWKLGYSHGPFSGPYLPLLTSRGCPYGCLFCVVPSTNERKWRARSAKNVVEEMEHWTKTLGVTDFHIEDLNPTIDKQRIIDTCEMILKKGLKITWKICAGTKLETLDEKELELMKKAGCVYISISPESGSPELMKKMNKPLDHAHCTKIIKRMSEIGIKSQACFVLGFPGETDEDRKMTRDYLKTLIKAGLDETAIFIITPIPGSQVYETMNMQKTSLEKLTFSPTWRNDYKKLQKFRIRLYLDFFALKGIYQPKRLLNTFLNLATGKFDLKGEMAFWRLLKTLRKRVG